MVLQWVCKDSELGAHTRGAWDLLWTSSYRGCGSFQNGGESYVDAGFESFQKLGAARGGLYLGSYMRDPTILGRC